MLGRGALSRLEAGGTRVPSLVMDRPVLHTFVDALRAHERFQGFAQALPTRARVSEPILPLMLAALHEELERPLVCLLPDDADARDAAEAAGWFLGTQARRPLPEPRRQLGIGARAAAAPRRRAGAGARRPRGGRARVRLGGSARRGAAARRPAARDAPPPGRRRAGLRGAGRAARARRLRARRARRGARPVRRPRRADRRLPLDRPRAAADRALRRRDRRHPRVLAVHAARAPARADERRSTRPPSGDST